MGDFDGLSENLVFQRLLAQDPLELSDALLEGFDLGESDYFFIDPDRLFPTLGHAPSPVKQQGGRNTMLPSHIGNRDPGPKGFLQDPRLLIDGMPPATLNTGINLNTLCIRRHSRMTRLTPSSYLRQHCPVEMGAAPPRKFAKAIDPKRYGAWHVLGAFSGGYLR